MRLGRRKQVTDSEKSHVGRFMSSLLPEKYGQSPLLELES